MVIIAVAQRKGGAGKTTLAVNLAGELVHRGFSVTLVDTDPQGSALEWATPRRLGFAVRQDLPTPRTLAAWVDAIEADPSEVVVIDTPPSFGTGFRAGVGLADLVLVPCTPSSLDIDATAQTLARVRALAKSRRRPGLRLALVPTRVDPGTPEGRQIAEELGAFGEAVAPALGYDMAFVRGFAHGESVASSAEGTAADRDMRALGDFVVERVGLI